MLGLVDVVVLAWLVSTYLRLRRRLAGMAATVTVDPSRRMGSDGHA